MSEENTSQKERFLQEVEQKLLHRELDARLLDDGLIHIRWNEKPLCSVDRDGIVRFRPADITGPEVDRQLRTVIQAAGQVKEYMQIFDRAPALKTLTGRASTLGIISWKTTKRQSRTSLSAPVWWRASAFFQTSSLL